MNKHDLALILAAIALTGPHFSPQLVVAFAIAYVIGRNIEDAPK